MKTAKQIVEQEYGKSSNFMTPNVVKYGKAGRTRAYELSWGAGILEGKLYGVSVVDVLPDNKTKRRTDLSRSFKSLSCAKEFIEELSKMT